MKILILENSKYITGSIRSVVALTLSLSDQFKFEFVMCKSDASKFVSNSGFVVHEINFLEVNKSISLIIYPLVLLINYYKIFKLSKKNSISLIHVNDLYNLVGIIFKIFRIKIPIVYHVRLLSDSYLSKIYFFYLYLLKKFADHTFYVSEAVGLNFSDNNKSSLVYDALYNFNTNKVNLRKTKRNNDFRNKGQFTFLYIGNYINGKGQNYAVDAFSKLIPVNSNIKLIFTGYGINGELDNIYINELKNSVINYNLAEYITFRDFTNDIYNLFDECDVLLNFSVSESFSMVCLEAVSYGLPVIASNSGGPSEIIENNKCGFIVENKCIDSMVNAMIEIIKDVNLFNYFSINGPIIAANKFNIKFESQKVSNIYKKLINS